MDTLDALKAKHAKEIDQLNTEIAVAERCAVTPSRVQLTSGGIATWLIYKAASLSAALDIMAAAPIVPFYRYKGTFTRVQPEALADDKSGAIVGGPYACSLKVEQGEGYGPTTQLRFFVMAGETLCQARVKLEGENHRDAYPQLGASLNVIRGYRNRIERRDWSANPLLSAHLDAHIKWGAGSDTSASYEYMLMSDAEDGGSTHAVEQLRTLIDVAKLS